MGSYLAFAVHRCHILVAAGKSDLAHVGGCCFAGGGVQLQSGRAAHGQAAAGLTELNAVRRGGYGHFAAGGVFAQGGGDFRFAVGYGGHSAVFGHSRHSFVAAGVGNAVHRLGAFRRHRCGGQFGAFRAVDGKSQGFLIQSNAGKRHDNGHFADVAQGAVRTGNGDDGFAALSSGQGAVFSNGHCRAIAGEFHTGLALCGSLFLVTGILVFVGIVHSQVNGLADFNGHRFRHIDAGNGGAASGQHHNCGHGSGHNKDSFHGGFLL